MLVAIDTSPASSSRVQRPSQASCLWDIGEISYLLQALLRTISWLSVKCNTARRWNSFRGFTLPTSTQAIRVAAGTSAPVTVALGKVPYGVTTNYSGVK